MVLRREISGSSLKSIAIIVELAMPTPFVSKRIGDLCKRSATSWIAIDSLKVDIVCKVNTLTKLQQFDPISNYLTGNGIAYRLLRSGRGHFIIKGLISNESLSCCLPSTEKPQIVCHSISLTTNQNGLNVPAIDFSGHSDGSRSAFSVRVFALN